MGGVKKAYKKAKKSVSKAVKKTGEVTGVDKVVGYTVQGVKGITGITAAESAKDALDFQKEQSAAAEKLRLEQEKMIADEQVIADAAALERKQRLSKGRGSLLSGTATGITVGKKLG
jgi:hypothetical protein